MSTSLPLGSKPSRALASDDDPNLARAYVISNGDGQQYVLATDRYKLAQVPLSGDSVPEGAISRDAMQHIEELGRFTADAEYVRPVTADGDNAGCLYDRPEGLRTPAVPTYEGTRQKAGPQADEATVIIGLNARQLFDLAEALDGDAVVKLTIATEKRQRAILVEPMRGIGRGLLMPVMVFDNGAA